MKTYCITVAHYSVCTLFVYYMLQAMLSANIRHKPVCSWIDKFCRLAQPLHSSGAQQHGVPKREEVNNEPKSFWEIPGPKPIPILGNILLLRKYLSRNSFRALYKDGFDKYGEIFKFIIPGKKKKNLS